MSHAADEFIGINLDDAPSIVATTQNATPPTSWETEGFQLDWYKLQRMIVMDQAVGRTFKTGLVLLFWCLFSWLVGVVSGSLALVSSAFCSSYDLAAIAVSLLSLVASKQKPTRLYSYGFDRFEILMVFASSSVMIFSGLYTFFEALEHFVEDEALGNEEAADISLWPVALTSLLGCFIHLFVTLFSSDFLVLRTESVVHSTVPVKVNVANLLKMQLFNVGSSLLVFIGSQAISITGWHWIDPLIASLNGFLLINKSVPHFISSGRVLLQSVPISIKNIIEQNLRDALTVEGVLEVHKTHFWTYSPGVFVGSLAVRVRGDADEQAVVKDVSNIFSPYIKDLTVQVEKW